MVNSNRRIFSRTKVHQFETSPNFMFEEHAETPGCLKEFVIFFVF